MQINWRGGVRGFWSGLWNPDKGEQRADAGIGRSSQSGVVVTDTLALQVGAAFRCIRLIAETCASLPIRAFRRVNDYDLEPLEYSHWLSTLLREPNETMAGDEWAESMYAQMAGWGNSYSQIVPNAAGRAVELWPYKVERMTVRRREDRTLEYQYPTPLGTPKILQTDRVMHMRAFSIDGVMGVSALGMARAALGLSIAAESYAGGFFASGGRPSGVMTSDKILTDKQREQIRKEYGSIAEGGDGKRWWLMEGSLKYQAITANPEDMQMFQTRSFQIAEIARFFGVPLMLLMETEKSTSWGSGMQEQNLQFLTYTLQPYLNRMESTFNRMIIPPADRGRICVEIDRSPLANADLAALSSYLSTGVQNGYIRRNEARRRLKLGTMGPIGDIPTAQVNMSPLDQLGQQDAATLEKMRRLQQLNELGQDSNVVPFSSRTPGAHQ